MSDEAKLNILSGSPTRDGKSKLLIDPWDDVASEYAPQDIPSALELCEFLYINDSTYREASERIVNYFLTRLLMKGQSDKEEDEMLNTLNKDINIMDSLQAMGFDWMCYGNSFISMSFPFTRTLKCEKCDLERNIKHVEKYSYDLKTGGVKTFCAKCGSDRAHKINDYKRKKTSEIGIVRWDPKNMSIRANRLTKDVEYTTKIPSEVKAGIKKGDKFYVATTPLGIMEAARQDKEFKFDKGKILHHREQFLSGLWLGGWGLPSILSSFKNFFRLQILKRYNESLMLDFIIPLRIISPSQGSYQEGNSIYNNLMGEWRENMTKAVTRHRSGNTDWNFFPFPITYQAVGGEGRQLAPTDMIDKEEDRLLSGRGIPPELYRTSMTLQAAPVGLRLFERSWQHLVQFFNKTAQFVANSTSQYLGGGEYEIEMESVKILDDLENKAWRLQAMSAGQLSKRTAMRPMGIYDPKDEFKQVLEEQRMEQEISQEMQREMEMSQMGLGQQQQGQGGQGGEGEATPGDIYAEGDAKARELVVMDETTRRRELHALSKTNETLHAIVLKRLDQLRNEARSMGMPQALQQVAQGTGPA